MSLVQRTVCSCDVCGHEWLPEDEIWPGGVIPQLRKLPARCPSRKCRSTGWNAKEKRLVRGYNEPKAEVCECASPYLGCQPADSPSRCEACGGLVKEVPTETDTRLQSVAATVAPGGRVLGAVPTLTVRPTDHFPPVAIEIEENTYPEDWVPLPRGNGTKKAETLAGSLCRHGLYAGNCMRCRYGSR